MKNIFKQSTFCRTISLFVILAFSFSNMSFASLRFSPIAKLSEDESAGSIKNNLSVALKVGFGSRLVLDKDVEENLKEWFKDISEDGVLEKIGEATGKCVEQYLDKMKNGMISDLKEEPAHREWMKVVANDEDWETIFTDFLGKYGKNLGDENIPNLIRERIKIEFDKFRERARGKAGLATRSPGEWYARTGANWNKPLTQEEHFNLNRAIAFTVEDLKEQVGVEGEITDKFEIQEKFMKRYGRLDSVTGGYFIVLPDELYEKYIESTNAPSDVECHPGTRKTRMQYEAFGSLESVEEYYYMRESSYNQLTKSEKAVLAQHETKHIQSALGRIELTPEVLEEFGCKSEEEWVNNQPGCDIRPIMARLSALRKQEKKFEDIFRRNEEIIGKEVVAVDGSLERYYEIAKVFGKHMPFTVKQFAKLINKKFDDAEEILEELWLKNKKINHVKGFGNEVWYEWDPIGPITIVTPDMTPDDIPVGAPMLVVIGHSEVRDYLDMGIKEIRAQRDLFQKAWYRIVGPWGDIMPDDEYIKRGLRWFPVTPNEIALKKTAVNDDYRSAIWKLSHEVDAVQRIDSIEGMKSHEEYGAYYDILEPLLKEEFKKLVDDVTKKAQENNETPDITGAIRKKYSLFFRAKSFDRTVSEGIDKTIEIMLNDTVEVKRRIIKEISTVYEINYQVKVLFEDLPIETVLYQFINPYEPIEGIRTVAIPKEVAKFRLEKMIPVFLELGVPSEMSIDQANDIATLFGYTFKERGGDTDIWWKNMVNDLREEYRKKLEISYGGGAKADNAEGMVDAGYNGAFVARYIYTVENAVKLAQTAASIKDGLDLLYNFKANEKGPWMPWIQAYENSGVDLEKVNIFHCILRLHIDAALRELRGEDVSELFRDAGTDKEKKTITIDARANNIATRGIGSNTGVIPAEFLASAGVTHAVVDVNVVRRYDPKSFVLTQIKNLVDAEITPVVIYSGLQDRWVNECKEKLKGYLSMKYINEMEFHPDDAYPITPINEVMAVHAEMNAVEPEPQEDTPLVRQRGYYEDVKEPEGVYKKITETIKSGAPMYWDLVVDNDTYCIGTREIPDTVPLPMFERALKYFSRSVKCFPEELLGKAAIQENGIVFPEVSFAEVEGEELEVVAKGMNWTIKDLSVGVREITMNQSGSESVLFLEKELGLSTPGFHVLVVKKGSAVSFITGARGDIKTAKIPSLVKGDFLLVIPASAKSVSIEALEPNVEILDMFIPLPERKIPIGKPFKQGKKIKETDIVASEESGVIKDYGPISEEVDVITINGEKVRPPSMITYQGEQRPHRLVVKSGAIEIEIDSGNPLLGEDEKTAVFGPGEAIDVNMDIRVDGDRVEGRLIIESPDGRKFHFRKPPMVDEITDYWIKKTPLSETVNIEVSYEKTEEEQSVYGVYEMLKKHASLIKGKKIDLIVPKEMFSESIGGEGSKEEAQRKLDGLFGRGAVKIKDYNSSAGLDQQDVLSLLRSSLSLESPEDARIPILFATDSNIKAMQPEYDFTMPTALEEILKQTKILSIADDLEGFEELGGKGWLYASTVLNIGVLQGCLTLKDIQSAEKGDETLAQDIKKMMRAVTVSRDIKLKDLYLMLSYNEIPTYQRIALQIGDAVTLMRMVMERLLLGMPMEKIVESDWKDRMDNIDSSL